MKGADRYPTSKGFGEFPSGIRAAIVDVVRKHEASLRAIRNRKQVQSEDVLAILAKDLQKIGFGQAPRRFELRTKAYEVDRFHKDIGVALEVEKGRVILGNQVYLDLFKFHVIPEVHYGAIILPSISREDTETPFDSASAILELVGGGSRSGLNVEGLLLVGY